MSAQKNRKKLQQILVTSSKIMMCCTYHIGSNIRGVFSKPYNFSSENALISYTDKWCSGHVQMWGCVELQQKQQQQQVDIMEETIWEIKDVPIPQANDLGYHNSPTPSHTLHHSPML